MEKITNYLTGECSEKERAEFEVWLNASDENRQEFERYQKIWQTAKTTHCLCKPNVEKAWGKMKICLEEKSKKTISLFQWSAMAAVFVTFLAFGWLFFTKNQKAITNDFQLVKTQTIKQSTPIVLSDGTKVWLNIHSELKYPKVYAKDKRVVYLKGEAFFEVAKNPQKPFQIMLEKGATIQVLGTSFNVKHAQEKVEVDVLTGKVAFGKQQTIQLTKGMKGVFTYDGEKLDKEMLDENSLAWKTGILTFKKVPLKKILEQVSNHYQVNLSLTETIYFDKELSATFDNQSLNEVIEILELIIEKEHIIKQQ